jgi:EAL domain-containing protein (putative c-di-GMP-specific phosphodiesterase class I)/ActR/RegA family two-component response regulator
MTVKERDRQERHAEEAAMMERLDPSPPDAFVIDDEDGICKFVSMTLDTLGIKAESFPSAELAVASLERGHPDFVFLDVALKESDAIDVIRTLGEKSYRGVVQLMSGSDTLLLDDVRRIGARHGLHMRPPLHKPFRMEAIRHAVTAAPLDGQPETTVTLSPAMRLGLDEALANGWLELWYQPKIDLCTKVLAGVEGLIRCRHPIHGILGPASFLPEASEASLTVLTEHVLDTALHDWDQLAGAGSPLRVAVNTSVGALTRLRLPAQIRQNRPKNEKWPGLILEVTESEVVKDVNLVHEIATQLRIYGITLAIDDFGEGYSSFARLRELPFCELKLDRSFVDGCAEDASNAGICQAVIDLAHHFGAVAVAEGLENASDLQAIHDMGCDIGQGYLFARPMPKSELISMLGERARTGQPWFA